MAQIDDAIAKVNAGLDLVAVRRRGNRLYVRGTFPAKPGKQRPAQAEIATGKTANPAGLVQARAIALEIESQLIREKFDWGNWLDQYRGGAPGDVREWVTKLEAAHWQQKERTPNTENTWRKDYGNKFTKLPQDKPLTLELLKEAVVEHSQPATRTRKGYAMAYSKLARFAGLDGVAELKALGQGYSASHVVPRLLPDDDAIAAQAERFTDPGWRWLYGAIAVYGLRPHETFLAQPIEADGILLLEIPPETKTGKAGVRSAFPLPVPGLEFSPNPKLLPPIAIHPCNNNQGAKLSVKFRSVGVPFTPYDLRHSYARRGYELGYPPEFLARSMGHSYSIHTRIYKAWMGQAADLKLFKALQQKTRSE